MALLGWILSGGSVDSRAPGVNVWETFLTVPLVMLAALGMLDIAERRIGFIPALTFGSLALADAALLTEKWWFRPASDALPEGSVGRVSVTGLALVALLAMGGVALAHLSRGVEARRRIALRGILLAIVAANCLWGVLAIRRMTPGDRELEELRAAARAPCRGVNRFTFVALRRCPKLSPAVSTTGPIGLHAGQFVARGRIELRQFVGRRRGARSRGIGSERETGNGLCRLVAARPRAGIGAGRGTSLGGTGVSLSGIGSRRLRARTGPASFAGRDGRSSKFDRMSEHRHVIDFSGQITYVAHPGCSRSNQAFFS